MPPAAKPGEPPKGAPAGGLPLRPPGTRAATDGKGDDMGIGVSIFLIAVGAILAFAVHVPSNGINLDTVGVILMILGLVGLLVLGMEVSYLHRTF